MHPYFVEIPSDPILFAEVLIDTQRVSWDFYLQKNSSINDADFESVENLFQLLGLSELYSQVSV